MNKNNSLWINFYFLEEWTSPYRFYDLQALPISTKQAHSVTQLNIRCHSWLRFKDPANLRHQPQSQSHPWSNRIRHVDDIAVKSAASNLDSSLAARSFSFFNCTTRIFLSAAPSRIPYEAILGFRAVSSRISRNVHLSVVYKIGLNISLMTRR